MANLTDIMLKTAKYGAYKRTNGEEVELVHLDAQKAARLMLRLAPKYRTLWEKLSRFVEEKKADGRLDAALDLEETLIRGMCRNHPDIQPGSVKKNVSNWKKSSFESAIKREYVIEICFILGLSPEESDEMMTRILDEGFHWRNPEDIIWLFALDQGKTYPQACEMVRRIKPIYEEAAKGIKPDERVLTEAVRREVKRLGDEQELIDYLTDSAPRLGTIRNTAYREFADLMDTLKHAPVSYIEEEKEAMRRAQERLKDVYWAQEKTKEEKEAQKQLEEKPLEQKEIVTRYLHRNMVPLRERRKRKADGETAKYERRKYTLGENVAKAIGESWPSDTTISSMMARSENVNRKVLILLALATDFEDEDDLYQEDLTAAEQFEISRSMIDDMLVRCGFGRLDPRSPFDWMVLYCLGAGDTFDIDKQMEDVLSELFDTGSEKQFSTSTQDTL